MTVFSKVVCAVAITDLVYGGPQTRGRQTESYWQTGMTRPFVRTMAFMSPGLAGAQATVPSILDMVNPFSKEDAFKMKYLMHQTELEGLLENEDNMVARFEEHMTNRYPKCEKVEVPLITGDTQTMEHCQPFRHHADDEESMEKLANFKGNVKIAYNRNLYSDQSVIHGITSMMDLSREQFMGLMGYNPQESLSKMTDEEKREYMQESLAIEDAPPILGGKKDWRDEGAITPIKDQSTCGSCWAFSSVETVESAAIIAGASDPKNPFIGSPSQLVDCEKQDFGCSGGLPSHAFKYLHKHPLEEEEKYGPYEPIQRHCHAKKDAGKGPEFEVTKSIKVSVGGKAEGAMKDFIMSKGPMSIAVHATSKWQTYVGGIMSYDDCDDTERPNHAVQAVALDADADTPYWVVRNSWAEGWGENGFIRLSYGQNTCNLASDSYSVEVEKKGPKESSTMVV